jgi:hypothetical protein
VVGVWFPEGVSRPEAFYTASCRRSFRRVKNENDYLFPSTVKGPGRLVLLVTVLSSVPGNISFESRIIKVILNWNRLDG